MEKVFQLRTEEKWLQSFYRPLILIGVTDYNPVNPGSDKKKETI